jgi:hypothetical protein
VVETVGKERGGTEREGDRDDEERYGRNGADGAAPFRQTTESPTSLPGTPCPGG